MSLKKEEVAGIRQEYKLGQLSEAELANDPLVQFRSWFEEAVNKGVMEPNAMTLSTVSLSGQPSSRIVLLKAIDEAGLGFYTNYNSRKGAELAANPHASILFFWPELQRQVRIEGKVVKLPVEASDTYFRSRPKGSKLGAIASPQSQEIESRDTLEKALHLLEQEYQHHEDVPRPAHWGGYQLQPSRFEFWQGGGNRLHDRLVYKKEDNIWKIVRLAP